MRFLVTGHTGFKGSWLTMMLVSMGHQVSGISLDPVPGSLFAGAHVEDFCDVDIRADIRDPSAVALAFQETRPEVLIHMAAQPLVPESYRRPRCTFETNVTGTLNVLEAAQSAPDLRASVIVTTDKVYRNINQEQGYVESDPLGGEDPYSASKAMSDVLTHSWAVSFPGPVTALARAGNVIGGGDNSPERLIPDIIRSVNSGQVPELRYPLAVRPWQHVLDCLNGYFTLAMAIANANPFVTSGDAWNFGPGEHSLVTVGDVTQRALDYLGIDQTWTNTSDKVFHEAGLLALDASKATAELGWVNLLNFDESLNWTLDWYMDVERGLSPRDVTMAQVTRFQELR